MLAPSQLRRLPLQQHLLTCITIVSKFLLFILNIFLFFYKSLSRHTNLITPFFGNNVLTLSNSTWIYTLKHI
jgi:hypothetical protein